MMLNILNVERVFWVYVMTINSHKDPVFDSLTPMASNSIGHQGVSKNVG